jgi:hypothetical protein
MFVVEKITIGKKSKREASAFSTDLDILNRVGRLLGSETRQKKKPLSRSLLPKWLQGVEHTPDVWQTAQDMSLDMTSGRNTKSVFFSTLACSSAPFVDQRSAEC